MKLSFSILLLLITINCIAQKAIFNKVIISWDEGHSSWGNPGVYSNGERFEFIRSKSGKYKIVDYSKTEFSAGDDGKRFTKDTTEIPVNKFEVPGVIIDSLYTELTTNKLNFSLNFIRPLLKNPSKIKIISIAKKIDKIYWFEDYHGEELAAKIKPMRQLEKIDSYIELKKPDPERSVVTMDTWNAAKVSFIFDKDTTVFKMDFLQPLGQPILKVRQSHQYIGKQVVNLDVNLLLESMLPLSSTLRKRVAIDNLTEDYIKWYINTVL